MGHVTVSIIERKFVHFFCETFPKTSVRKDVVQSFLVTAKLQWLKNIRPRSLTKKTARSNFGNTKQPWGQSDKYSHERVGIKSLSKLQVIAGLKIGALEGKKTHHRTSRFQNPKRGPQKSCFWHFDSFFSFLADLGVRILETSQSRWAFDTQNFRRKKHTAY